MSNITDSISRKCYSQLYKFLYKECEITPLENQSGMITAIGLYATGLQFRVRYFIDGQYKEELFYDFDIQYKDVGGVLLEQLAG